MKIRIKYFGQIAEITGSASEEVDVNNDAELSEIKKILENKYDIGQTTFRLVLNQEFAAGEKKLKNNDEVALLPPFAGG